MCATSQAACSHHSGDGVAVVADAACCGGSNHLGKDTTLGGAHGEDCSHAADCVLASKGDPGQATEQRCRRTLALHVRCHLPDGPALAPWLASLAQLLAAKCTPEGVLAVGGTHSS